MKRMYDSVRWRKARAWFLSCHPFCVFCQQLGRQTLANTVDHVIPHKGDYDLFWDDSNWQSLCATCHSSIKKRMEMQQVDGIGCDADGNPVATTKGWN